VAAARTSVAVTATLAAARRRQVRVEDRQLQSARRVRQTSRHGALCGIARQHRPLTTTKIGGYPSALSGPVASCRWTKCE
jgi:hypothetical protein